MLKPKPPCKDCTKRKARCHASCLKYAAFAEALEEYNRFVRENKTKDDDVLSAIIPGKRRMQEPRRGGA